MLDVMEPADEAVVRTDSVRVAGSIAPAGSAVRVNGSVAEVEGDEFVADVPLDPGANVIDVIASARGRAPALTAIRVTRELPVEVPDVGGLAVEEAESRLATRASGPSWTRTAGSSTGCCRANRPSATRTRRRAPRCGAARSSGERRQAVLTRSAASRR